MTSGIGGGWTIVTFCFKLRDQIATDVRHACYDKLATNSLGNIHLAAAAMWWL